MVWRAVFPKPGEGELQTVLNEAKKMGLTTTVNELSQICNRGAKNVAAIWQKISGSPLTLLSKASPPIESSTFNSALSGSGDLETTKRIVEILEPLAAKYEGGLSGDFFSPKRNWEKPFSITFPEFGKFRDATRLFGLRALTKASLGDAKGCIEDVRRVVKINKLSEQQPFLISGLVTLGNRASFYRLTGAIVSELQDNPEFLQQFLRELKSLHDFDGRRFIGYELAAFRGGIEQIRNGDNLGLGSNSTEDNLISKLGRFAADSAELIGTKSLVEMAKAWPDDAKLEAINKRLKDDGASNWLRPGYAIAYIMIPELGNFARRVEDLRISNEVAQIAVSAFLIKSKTGTRPTLAESANYAGLSTKDPFGDKDLIFVWKEDRLEVRSVGRNGKDDGGSRRRPADDFSSVSIQEKKN